MNLADLERPLSGHDDRRPAGHVAPVSAGGWESAYRQQGPAQRRLFRLLSLIPGTDFGVPAAGHLLGPKHAADTPRLLSALADAGLIERISPARYAIGPVLRRLAMTLARREEPAEDLARSRAGLHAYYILGTDAAICRLFPLALRLPIPGGGTAPATLTAADALDWLNTERDTLLALIHATADGPDQATCWLLADALRMYFYIHRHTEAWLTAATCACHATRAAGAPAGARAAALMNLGTAHSHHNDFQQAVTEFEQALELTRAAGWMEGEAAVLNNLGLAYLVTGQLDDAYQALSHAATLVHSNPTPSGRAIVYSNLGLAEHLLGRSEDGLKTLHQAATIHHRVGNFNGEADALRKIGTVHLQTGRPDLAIGSGRAALAVIATLSGRMFGTDALNLVGSAYLALGHPVEALEQHEKARQLGEEIGDRYAVAEALIGAAEASVALGHLHRARGDAEQALQLVREFGYRLLEGHALNALAEILIHRGDTVAAREHAQKALEIQRLAGYRFGAQRSGAVLGLAAGLL